MINDYSLGGTILLISLSLIAAIVLYPLISMAYRLFKSKQNLKFYKKQGGVIRFYPMLGFQGLESRTAIENLKVSNQNLILKLARENPNPKALFIATNMIAQSSCVVQLYGSDLVKEFLIKEDYFV